MARCHYCRSNRAETKDHRVPRSRGGSNRADNKVPCCRICNTLKGDMLPPEWDAYQLTDEYQKRRARLLRGVQKRDPWQATPRELLSEAFDRPRWLWPWE